jgi:hypothetical protein
MKKVKIGIPLIIILPFLILLNSCLGINADIAINENGSGTITIEYHIPLSLDSLGKLDGNERWNTVPVGRADFERTLDRLPEINLRSFLTKESGKNLVTTVKMEFDNIRAPLFFLDSGGRRSSFSGDGKSGSLVMTLNEGSGAERKNSSLLELIRKTSESYSIKAAMSFPSEGSLVVTDSQGRPLEKIPGSEIHGKGKKVSFSFPLYEVLSSTEGIVVEFRW